MSDKTALVSGVSAGIGHAIAHELKQIGWRVIGIDSQQSEHCVFRCDLSTTEFIFGVIELLTKEKIMLDGLVSCAGTQVASALIETSVEDWDYTFAVNLRAPFLLIKHLKPFLNPGASVVNVSSVHSRASSESIGAYATSKAALSALTRSAAIEFGKFGVRVNSVAPGAVNTPMLLRSMQRYADPSAALARLAKSSPLGTIATPDEIASVVCFLLDNEASSFMTGSELVCDGGVTAMLASE